jgi:hypothetical protein
MHTRRKLQHFSSQIKEQAKARKNALNEYTCEFKIPYCLQEGSLIA